ncbi:MAG: hypothetical protein Q7T82_12860 [Armatimonadota bacterium]|nr:hypothetical protein [Armatimonadota bacterium]
MRKLLPLCLVALAVAGSAGTAYPQPQAVYVTFRVPDDASVQVRTKGKWVPVRHRAYVKPGRQFIQVRKQDYTRKIVALDIPPKYRWSTQQIALRKAVDRKFKDPGIVIGEVKPSGLSAFICYAGEKPQPAAANGFTQVIADKEFSIIISDSLEKPFYTSLPCRIGDKKRFEPFDFQSFISPITPVSQAKTPRSAPTPDSQALVWKQTLERGKEHLRAARYEPAGKAFEKLKNTPHKAAACFFLGYVAEMSNPPGKYDAKVNDYYDQAAKLDHASGSIRLQWQSYLIRCGKVPEADQVAKLYPETQVTLENQKDYCLSAPQR